MGLIVVKQKTYCFWSLFPLKYHVSQIKSVLTEAMCPVEMILQRPQVGDLIFSGPVMKKKH